MIMMIQTGWILIGIISLSGRQIVYEPLIAF